MNIKSDLEVIYIAAIGHSGSTILDLLLETSKGVFSVGELKQLQDFCSQNKHVDTGTPLQDSEMWGGFCANIEKYLSSPDASSRFQKGMQMIFPNLFRAESQYKNHTLFTDIPKRAEDLKGEKIDTIIDSSKDPHRMATLHENKKINTRIIHLIRSPWGVAYSHIKDDRKLLLGCWRWLRTNLLIAWYLFWCVSVDDYIRVLYTSLCAETSRELRRITEHFNLEPVPDSYLERINTQISYRFAGNALRHKEIKEIRYDTRWKEGLTFFQKLVVGLLCGPLYLAFLISSKLSNH